MKNEKIAWVFENSNKGKGSVSEICAEVGTCVN